MTTIRVVPDMITAVRRLAERDGMTISAWIRREVEREIARREGKCPTCGRNIP